MKKSIRAVIDGLREKKERVGATDRSRQRASSPMYSRAAVHESGHTLLGWFSLYAKNVQSVIIHGDGGGATHFASRIDRPAACWDMIVVVLAGVAAEMAVFGSGGRGAKKDFETARTFAQKIIAEESARVPAVCPWKHIKMDKSLDFRTVFSPAPSKRECEILRICYDRARSLLLTHCAVLDKLTAELDKKGSLTEADLLRLLGPRPWTRLGR